MSYHFFIIGATYSPLSSFFFSSSRVSALFMAPFIASPCSIAHPSPSTNTNFNSSFLVIYRLAFPPGLNIHDLLIRPDHGGSRRHFNVAKLQCISMASPFFSTSMSYPNAQSILFNHTTCETKEKSVRRRWRIRHSNPKQRSKNPHCNRLHRKRHKSPSRRSQQL